MRLRALDVRRLGCAMVWLLGLKCGLSDQFEGRVIIPRSSRVSKVLEGNFYSVAEKLVKPL